MKQKLNRIGFLCLALCDAFILGCYKTTEQDIEPYRWWITLMFMVFFAYLSQVWSDKQ